MRSARNACWELVRAAATSSGAPPEKYGGIDRSKRGNSRGEAVDTGASSHSPAGWALGPGKWRAAFNCGCAGALGPKQVVHPGTRAQHRSHARLARAWRTGTRHKIAKPPWLLFGAASVRPGVSALNSSEANSPPPSRRFPFLGTGLVLVLEETQLLELRAKIRIHINNLTN
jgi:hypothetical protein